MSLLNIISENEDSKNDVPNIVGQDMDRPPIQPYRSILRKTIDRNHSINVEETSISLKTLPLTSSVDSFDEVNSTTFDKNIQSNYRNTCVTFTNEQPTIFHRNSSTSQLSSTSNRISQERSSMTTSDFRPVYVSPLKYRPLSGLTANDRRLLLEKRVSLLGKPLVFHPVQKRSPLYRRTQVHIYNFLERANGYKAIIYHSFVFLTVFLCLFLSVIVTMPEYEALAASVLLPTEIIVFVWLTIELSLRIWSAGCRSRYQTLMGRLRFMKKPFCALDLFVIVATFLTLCLNIRTSNGVFAASALRGLRFFQILRMLRMDRRAGTWKLLGSVVYAHRQELITTIYIGFLVLIFSSFVMYLAEKDSNIETNQTISNNNNNITNIMATGAMTNLIDSDRHKFQTFADALWWAIITLCTVGYGDKVPSSYTGKCIAAICSFIGISFFALPAGILGSGFALKVQQQQRQKHYKRRKIPAVLLIQNLWRVYAADEKSLSIATWKVHIRPVRIKNDVSLTSLTNHNSSIPFKTRYNQSFLNRVSFRRRAPARTASPVVTNNLNIYSDMKSITNPTISSIRTCTDMQSDTTGVTPSASFITSHEGSSSDIDDDHFYCANDVQSLTTIHRNAIRFIRKVKYFVARRKFREALRPYDVTDVIEQYSTGNVDMLARLKYMQAKLDRVLGPSKSVDGYESGLSLASRICKIEKQVDSLNFKIDQLCQMANGVLDNNMRQSQQGSVLLPGSPIAINRRSTGNRIHIPRYRRYLRPRSIRSMIIRAFTRHKSSISVKHTSPSIIDNSNEDLVDIGSLFRDNTDSSLTNLT